MKMFLVYDKKDKAKFIIFKSFVFIAIVLFGILALKTSDIDFPSFEEKVSFTIGFFSITVVVMLALINRIKWLFHFKSIDFIIVSLILFFLKGFIEALSISFILVSIPLLLDDMIINNYFKYLNMTKYFEHFKFVGAHNES